MDNLKDALTVMMLVEKMAGDEEIVALTKIGMNENLILEKVMDAPLDILENVIKLQEETLKLLEGGH